MTSRTKKRDLRTRVTEPAFARLRAYAEAQEITLYQAAERLVLLGLETQNRAPSGGPDPAFLAAVASLSARVDALAALIDRAVFGSLVSYAYARAAALADLAGDARQSRDRALLEAGQEAYDRQRKQALEN